MITSAYDIETTIDTLMKKQGVTCMSLKGADVIHALHAKQPIPDSEYLMTWVKCIQILSEMRAQRLQSIRNEVIQGIRSVRTQQLEEPPEDKKSDPPFPLTSTTEYFLRKWIKGKQS